MSNRAQRRAAAKKTPRWMPATKDQRIKALVQNGITPQDLAAEYNKGFKAGFAAATEPAVKTCYAAFCLAMKEELGFGHTRVKRVLKRADEIVLDTLASAEIIDEVFKKLGLTLDFDEPFDRINDAEEAIS